MPVYPTYVSSRAEVTHEMNIQKSPRHRGGKAYRSDLTRDVDFLRQKILASGRRKAGLELVRSADFGRSDAKARRDTASIPFNRCSRSHEVGGTTRSALASQPRNSDMVPQDASSIAAHDAGDLDPRHQAQRRPAARPFPYSEKPELMEPRGIEWAAINDSPSHWRYAGSKLRISSIPVDGRRVADRKVATACLRGKGCAAKPRSNLGTDPVPRTRTRCGNLSIASRRLRLHRITE